MENINNSILTNFSIINEICSPVIKLGMIRYEAMFDFLSEEPRIINVKEKEDCSVECMEQIFRMRRWGNNTKSSSLSIFAIEREWNNKDYNSGMVVREVSWDMKADVDKIKSCSKINRDKMLQEWPNISSKIFWISINDCKRIIESIKDFDKIISNGIFLKDREDTCVRWKNFEIRRLLNWGGVYIVYGLHRKNMLKLRIKLLK